MDDEKKLSWREPLAVVLAIVLSDAAIYHGAGFAGIAAQLVGLLLLFYFGVFRARFDWKVVLFSLLTILVAVKLCWSGCIATAILGFGCLTIVAALLVCCPIEPYNLSYYLLQAIGSGGDRVGKYVVEGSRRCRPIRLMEAAAVLVPLIFVLIFSGFFIFANPNILAWIQNVWESFLEWLPAPWEWFPGPLQLLFWLGVAILMFGLLSPRLPLKPTSLFDFLREAFQTPPYSLPQSNLPNFIAPSTELPVGPSQPTLQQVPDASQQTVESSSSVTNSTVQSSQPIQASVGSLFYSVCRNTLIALIVLFTIYLVFEFQTNWRRDFPDDLDYSAYMHQGAMFLTAALALSTAVLCLIFQKSILADPRVARLRQLALVWSGLNILLAFSVYNRLGIYIELNGLSRLRFMGLLGVTAVLLGLLLVIRKISAAKSFRWLLAGFAWSVLAVVFFYLVAPIDSFIARHNVRRVMNNELLPSIFLLHNDTTEDLLYSLPLLNCPDEIIREGSRAIISQRWEKLQAKRENQPPGTYRWTTFQGAEEEIVRQLEDKLPLLEPFSRDRIKRKETIEQFRRYTNRWIN